LADVSQRAVFVAGDRSSLLAKTDPIIIPAFTDYHYTLTIKGGKNITVTAGLAGGPLYTAQATVDVSAYMHSPYCCFFLASAATSQTHNPAMPGNYWYEPGGPFTMHDLKIFSL